MHIKDLKKALPNSNTWQWRTVEGDTGLYYTFSDGTGIHFWQDGRRFHHKVATCEKFKVCKTASGTRQKLNRIFAEIEADPTVENPWKL